MQLQVWQQAARTLATLATKLRLCPHSRTNPKTITRRSRGVGISAYDLMELDGTMMSNPGLMSSSFMSSSASQIWQPE